MQDVPINLEPLLPHLPVWLLVFFRLAGLFVLAPIFSNIAIPARIKVAWTLVMSLCIYPVLLNRQPAASLITPMLQNPLTLWTLPALMTTELALGALLGLGASLPLVGMQIAGNVADQQVGLGLAGIFNPDLNEETGAIGQFYFLLATCLFLVLGGHRILVSTLLQTFDHVPLGGFTPNGQILELLIGLFSAMFELAIRIAAPLLCIIFLETIAMGFIARTVPQLNILSVGFPIRIIVGISMLAAALIVHAAVCSQSITQAFQAISNSLTTG